MLDFQFLFLRTSIIYFSLEILLPKEREVHKFITLGLQMWHKRPCIYLVVMKTPITFTYHFFMRCQNFSNQRNVLFLFDDLSSINSEILKKAENEIVQVLLFGNEGFSEDMNFRIIISSIRLIKDSKKFDESLSLREKPFWYIFAGIKIWNIFLPSVLVSYVNYLLWRAYYKV